MPVMAKISAHGAHELAALDVVRDRPMGQTDSWRGRLVLTSDGRILKRTTHIDGDRYPGAYNVLAAAPAGLAASIESPQAAADYLRYAASKYSLKPFQKEGSL
jgi:hypothetical protein